MGRALAKPDGGCAARLGGHGFRGSIRPMRPGRSIFANKRSVMSLRNSASTFTHHLAPLLAALCISLAGAFADDSRSLDKYPDLRGQWNRTFVPRWTISEEKAPLTPE